MTWKGWLIQESLENTNILSKLKITNSMIEQNEEGDQVEVWHLDTIEVDDKNSIKLAKELKNLMKFGYYTHFTDYKNLLIVFRGKHFKIRAEVIKEKKTRAVEFKANPKDLNIWKQAFDYGTKKGKVDPRYIVKVV